MTLHDDPMHQDILPEEPEESSDVPESESGEIEEETEISFEEEQENIPPRRRLRALIFHVLYVAESLGYEESVDVIINNLNRGFDLDIEPEGEIATTSREIIANREQLDQEYQPLLQNWHIDRVSVCTRLVLRYAIWELIHTDVDTRIIINEAIELAKCFAEKDAYKFINGILDQLVKNIRPNESADAAEQDDETPDETPQMDTPE